MAGEQFVNNGFSTLASTITAGATSLSVAAGHGVRFPSTGTFRLRIDSEIMIATARSVDAITVTRGAEGTTGASHTAGAAVNQVFTKGALLTVLPERNVLDYGADNTGATDSVTAVAAAIADMADKGTLVFPKGEYHLASAITLAAAITIRGDGMGVTVIKSTSTTANTFLVTTADPVQFRDMTLGTTVTKTAGAGIAFNPTGSTQNARSVFDNVMFTNQYTGLDLTDAALFEVTKCQFEGFVQTGIWVDCPANEDNGDHKIIGCDFRGGAKTGTVASIRHIGGGGIRISGNKNISSQYFYFGDFGPTSISNGIQLIGNNVEDCGIASFAFANASSSAGMSNILIANNKLGGTPIEIWVKSVGGANWIYGFDIVGNVVDWTNYTFLQVESGKRYSVHGNECIATGTSTFIAQSGTAAEVEMGPNSLFGFTTTASGTVGAMASLYAREAVGTATAANGLNSNIAAGNNGVLRLTGPTGAYSIGGFTGGVQGRRLTVLGLVFQTMTIVNEDASSTAANRIATGTAANVVCTAGALGRAVFVYDATTGSPRWMLESYV